MKARRQLVEQLLLLAQLMLMLLLLMVEDVAQPKTCRQVRIHHERITINVQSVYLCLCLLALCYHSAFRRNTDRV